MSPSMGALEKSTSLFSLDQNGVENSSVHSGSLDDNYDDNGSLAAFGGKVNYLISGYIRQFYMS